MTRLGILLVACLAAEVLVPWHSAAAEETTPPASARWVSGGQEPEAHPPSLSRSSLWAKLYCEPPSFCCPGPPVFGYDGNLYVRDRRDRFTFRPSAFTQLRWTWNERTNAPAGDSLHDYDADFARTRIRLQGRATKWVDYDLRWNIDDAGDVDILAAALTLNAGKGWFVQAGQLFLAMTREDWANPQDVLATDYSANDLVFAPGVGRGVQVHWEGTHDRAWLAYSDGQFRGGNHLVGVTGNADWAFTGRYEHQFCTTDWSLWDDLVGRRGRGRGYLVGVGGGVGQGDEDVDVDLEVLLTADGSVNWSGGQALLAGTFRNTKDKDGDTANVWGLLAQAGHFVTPTLELYGRYDLVSPGDSPGDLEAYQSLTVGCGFLPLRWTNRYRMWAEFGYLFSPIDRTIVPATGGLGFLPSEEDQFYVRLQIQFGI